MSRKKRYKNKKNAINAAIAQEPNSSMIDSKLDNIRKDTKEKAWYLRLCPKPT